MTKATVVMTGKLILAFLLLVLLAQPAYSQFSNATAIWNRNINSLAPADGQALCWNAGTAKWTPAACLNAGPTGPGIAAGGAVGQILSKTGSGDYITGWVAAPLTQAAVTHQVLLSYTSTTGAFTQGQLAFADISGLAPIAASGSASDLTTGTLPDARLSSNVVKYNTAGSYTFGAKQTFGSSATTAMWNLGTLTADPSSLSTSDFWYRSDLFLIRYIWSGIKGSLPYVVDPLPTSGLCAQWLANGQLGAAAAACGSGGGGGFYQTVISDSTTMTQRTKLNLKAGTGITLTPVDNAGANSSEITITSTGGTGTAPYISSLITGPDSSKTITGATHGFTNSGLIVKVFDNSTPRQEITPSLYTVNASTYDVVVTFGSPQSNYYVVINGGVGPQGPTGPTGPAGSGSSAVLTSVSFSASPTYVAANSTIQVFNVGALTASITSPTFTTTSATNGQTFQWIFVQNATGGFSVTHPTHLVGACAVDPTPLKQTIITAVWNGTDALATGCTINENWIGLPEITTPITAASGNAICWADSTDHSGLECTANGSSSKFKLVLSGVDINPVTGQVTGGSHLTSGSAVVGQKFFGTAPPGSVVGNLPGDTFVDTTNHHIYQCGAASGTVAPACTTVSSTGWIQTDGGGGSGGTGNAASVVTTTFSTTPTFTCPSSSAGTVTTFLLSTAITANIASSTLATCTNGQTLHFVFTQDGTGGRTVVMPSGFDAAPISPTVAVTTSLSYIWDGTNGHLINSSTDTASQLFMSERSAAGTPASGKTFCWPDSTTHVLSCKSNNSATVSSMVVPNAGTSHQFATAISAAGVVSTAPIGATDLPPAAIPSPGTSITLAVPAGYAICTGTCTITLPTPAAGYQFCARNDAAVSTAITFAALGGSLFYEKPDHSGYGTSGTGTLAATAASGNSICIVGRDATHYLVFGTPVGTWTAN